MYQRLYRGRTMQYVWVVYSKATGEIMAVYKGTNPRPKVLEKMVALPPLWVTLKTFDDLVEKAYKRGVLRNGV